MVPVLGMCVNGFCLVAIGKTRSIEERRRTSMGLLSKGTPLSWADTKKNAALVHKVGIQQFLAVYHNYKDRKGDTLKWGDEVS